MEDIIFTNAKGSNDQKVYLLGSSLKILQMGKVGVAHRPGLGSRVWGLFVSTVEYHLLCGTENAFSEPICQVKFQLFEPFILSWNSILFFLTELVTNVLKL